MAVIVKSPKPISPAPKNIKPPVVVPAGPRPQGGLTTEMHPPVMMHNGGPVAADGVYRLKKGEHVLTEKEAKQARKHALMQAGMKSLAKEPKGVKAVATSQPKPVEKKLPEEMD